MGKQRFTSQPDTANRRWFRHYWMKELILPVNQRYEGMASFKLINLLYWPTQMKFTQYEWVYAMPTVRRDTPTHGSEVLSLGLCETVAGILRGACVTCSGRLPCQHAQRRMYYTHHLHESLNLFEPALRHYTVLAHSAYFSNFNEVVGKCVWCCTWCRKERRLSTMPVRSLSNWYTLTSRMSTLSTYCCLTTAMSAFTQDWYVVNNL